MTPRQQDYITHRAAGLPPTSAARAAGYASKSAKVTACRMEANPEIAAALAEARDARPEAAQPEEPEESPTFQTAEDYLQAVVQGLTPPDPVRVSAARALIQYQRPKQRAPVKSPAPQRLAESEALCEETALREAWEQKASAIRARKKTT